ncbi:MAG: YbaB/EbfC family nucleoid-associated protein [Bacteroidia bacterium]|nr:YbaB/EbfC family nucleoid-associated protein [Bacteroidia bacterium]
MWDFVKMVKRMQNLAQELETTTVVGEGAEGKVRITLTGHQVVKSVEIAPELLQTPGKIEEGVAQAFHDAREKLQNLIMERLGGEIPPFIPGLSTNIGLG